MQVGICEAPVFFNVLLLVTCRRRVLVFLTHLGASLDYISYFWLINKKNGVLNTVFFIKKALLILDNYIKPMKVKQNYYRPLHTKVYTTKKRKKNKRNIFISK
jgi:hypothetical protein